MIKAGGGQSAGRRVAIAWEPRLRDIGTTGIDPEKYVSANHDGPQALLSTTRGLLTPQEMFNTWSVCCRRKVVYSLLTDSRPRYPGEQVALAGELIAAGCFCCHGSWSPTNLHIAETSRQEIHPHCSNCNV